jgi:hypothetical protein
MYRARDQSKGHRLVSTVSFFEEFKGMRVNYLFVIYFPNGSNDGECLAAAEALAKRKPKEREPGKKQDSFLGVERQATWLIQVKNDKTLLETDDVSAACKVVMGGELPVDMSNQANVGVYLVFHGSSAYPFLFGRSQIMNKATDDIAKDKQGGGLIRILEALGITRIRKLCLVACKQAPERSKDTDTSFLSAVAKAFEKWPKENKPMIAGWDAPVYVDDKTGRKQDDPSGRKNPDKYPKFVNDHKKVMVLGSTGNYSLQKYKNAGWSDKTLLFDKDGAVIGTQK